MEKINVFLLVLLFVLMCINLIRAYLIDHRYDEPNAFILKLIRAEVDVENWLWMKWTDIKVAISNIFCGDRKEEQSQDEQSRDELK